MDICSRSLREKDVRMIFEGASENSINSLESLVNVEETIHIHMMLLGELLFTLISCPSIQQIAYLRGLNIASAACDRHRREFIRKMN